MLQNALRSRRSPGAMPTAGRHPAVTRRRHLRTGASHPRDTRTSRFQPRRLRHRRPKEASPLPPPPLPGSRAYSSGSPADTETSRAVTPYGHAPGTRETFLTGRSSARPGNSYGSRHVDFAPAFPECPQRPADVPAEAGRSRSGSEISLPQARIVFSGGGVMCYNPPQGKSRNILYPPQAAIPPRRAPCGPPCVKKRLGPPRAMRHP
jgi:hypothetical protein